MGESVQNNLRRGSQYLFAPHVIYHSGFAGQITYPAHRSVSPEWFSESWLVRVETGPSTAEMTTWFELRISLSYQDRHGPLPTPSHRRAKIHWARRAQRLPLRRSSRGIWSRGAGNPNSQKADPEKNPFCVYRSIRCLLHVFLCSKERLCPFGTWRNGGRC